MEKDKEIEDLANLLVQEYFDCNQAPLEAAKRIIKSGYSKRPLPEGNVQSTCREASQEERELWNNLIFITKKMEEREKQLSEKLASISASPVAVPSKEDIKDAAMEVLYHIESMYPEVWSHITKSCRISVRGTIINKFNCLLTSKSKV